MDPKPPATTTLSASRARQRTPLGSSAQLFLLLECDRPLASSERWLLGDADLVSIGRGRSRAASVDPGETLTRLAIAVPDGRLSREHLRLVRAHGRWVLEDAGSKNGTQLNGAPVRRKPLADGDVIEIGHTLFLFRDAVPPARDASPVAPALRTYVASLADAFTTLAKVAASSLPVMILGDTGTGKEVVARAVHDLSRPRGPFVAVNCGALPQTLVEA